MSLAYNNYLEQHIANVGKAYGWLKEYLPEMVEGVAGEDEWSILKLHDESKYTREEYDAYDEYFYGKTKSPGIEEAFKYAWLNHIHNNPHHWQHWVLINDEPGEGIVALDMPYHYIIEMICDWWSFSWSKGYLGEVLTWYDEHKDNMILSDKTRKTVEDILGKIKDKLDELESDDEDTEEGDE